MKNCFIPIRIIDGAIKFYNSAENQKSVEMVQLQKAIEKTEKYKDGNYYVPSNLFSILRVCGIKGNK